MILKNIFGKCAPSTTQKNAAKLLKTQIDKMQNSVLDKTLMWKESCTVPSFRNFIKQHYLFNNNKIYTNPVSHLHASFKWSFVKPISSENNAILSLFQFIVCFLSGIRESKYSKGYYVLLQWAKSIQKRSRIVVIRPCPSEAIWV